MRTETQKTDMFKVLYRLTNLLTDPNTNLRLRVHSILSSCTLNLLASIKTTSEFLAVPQIRKLIEKLLCPHPAILPLEYTYSIVSALHSLKWPFLADFLLPSLWPLLHTRLTLEDADHPPDCSATASLMANIAHVGKHGLPQALMQAIMTKCDWAMKTIIGHLQSFLTSLDASTPASDSLLDVDLHEASDWLHVFIELAPDPKLQPHFRTHTLQNDWIKSFEEFLAQVLNASRESVEVYRNRYLTDYQSGQSLNQTMLISHLIRLAQSVAKLHESPTCEAVIAGVPRLIELWGWHRHVLHAISDLCHDAKLSPAKHLLPSLGSVYQHLRAAVVSESASVRLQTLKILALLNEEPVRGEIIGQCLTIEETPLLVENARERQMHIRKLGIMVKSNSAMKEDSEEVDLAQRYILGASYLVSSLHVCHNLIHSSFL